MTGLPLGTVTFLMTDVEGSTTLWEQAPDVMRGALERHDAVIGEAVRAHGGILVKARGEGDSHFAVFAHAGDAVSCATDAQRALTSERWPDAAVLRVRMAVHTGDVSLRDGDYYGPTVNRCARLRAIGHGGQVLVSGSSASLAAAGLPAGSALMDLGHHRLKDLAAPEHVHQVVGDGLAGDFPPLRSLDARPNNLPVELSSFVGREDDLAAVTSMLDDHRLVTLMGAGGAGKTRLARQAAAERIDLHPDGVWLVELAPLGDAALLVDTVAATLGVQETPGRTIDEALVAHLATKRVLLVLDNCEHLISACASLAERLLRSCPELTVLATSREALGVPGESAWRVPCLSLPEGSAGPEVIARYESVRLFMDRARAVRPDFEVTDENAEAVAQICARLDGIPLAIELAAARVAALTPGQIASRLDDRFRLLTGGARTAMPRQQTLRALVDWGHDLLQPDEQMVLRRLSVFVGGCTLEAAEAVCGGDDIDGMGVLDALSGLVDKSFLSADPVAGVTRYRMLETIRQYGHERLMTSGEAAEVRDRHLRWAADLAWTELGEELDNLRAATEWAIDARDSPAMAVAQRLLGRLRAADRLREAEDWFQRLQPVTEGDDRLILQRWGGEISWERTRYEEAFVRSEAALGAASAATPADVVMDLYNTRGVGAWQTGRLGEARRSLEVTLTRARELGNVHHAALALQNLGLVAWAAGDYDDAEAFIAQGLTEADGRPEANPERYLEVRLASYAAARGRTEEATARIHDLLQAQERLAPWAIAVLHCDRSDLLWAAGDPRGAIAAREQAAEAVRDEDSWIHCKTRAELASLLVRVGELDRARSMAEAALTEATANGLLWLMSTALSALAEVEVASGDHEAARGLYLQALDHARIANRADGTLTAQIGLADLDLDLDPAAARRGYIAALAVQPERAAPVQALVGMAQVAADEHERAVLLTAADALVRQLGTWPPMVEQRAAKVRASVPALLLEEAAARWTGCSPREIRAGVSELLGPE